MRPIKNTLPVNLLLEGSTVLVVGGGRVALRKTRTVLDAGASVRVVCPKALVEFSLLPVELRTKCFDPADLTAVRVVFACTDDKWVNRAVLEAARAAAIPCCCADGHWAEADFIVPAIVRTEELLFSVSTNGRSCREAKEVKAVLERFLRYAAPGTLYIHGIGHETCALRDVATYALPTVEARAAVSKRLGFLNGLYEWCFVNTCNRIELIAWATPELIASGLLNHALHLPAQAHSYQGDAAMRYLTFVLAGLRAQMLGEFHIVGQIRDAFNEAREQGWAKGPLQEVYAKVLRRSQAVRTAVAPHIPEMEIEDLALEGATGKVVIAGTGALGRAVRAKCQRLGVAYEVLYHQTKPEGDCVSRPLTEWRAAMVGATRFVSALTVPAPLFDAAALGVPCYDLGVPRNITGADVLDLDALKGAWLRAHGCLEAIFAVAEKAYQEVCRGE
ncbi:MAG: NAD(P)-dependent oxidoreductase [Kiritimatiellia bacterium]